MKFSTKVPIGRYTNTIDYSSRILSIGSCFAENIGAKFEIGRASCRERVCLYV